MADGWHLGMIGYGAIARDVQAHVARLPDVRITLLTRSGRPVNLPEGIETVETVEALIDAGPDFVVEMAGQGAVRAYGPALLSAGIATLICSTGALAEPAFFNELKALSEASGAALILPHGAIGGLDYLRTIALLPDASVRYTARKPLVAWTAELRALGHDPDTLHAAVTLFEGSAPEAARLYPKNLNAGLTVALAVGVSRVTVRVVADPDAAGNLHEIEATSSAGTAEFRFRNTPSPDNPKTSMVTALSVVSAIDEYRGRKGGNGR